MRRRQFLSFLGGAAAWPVAARAQPMPVVGYIASTAPAGFAHLVAAFRQGLGETGYVEGRNVVIEYRWAEGRHERLVSFVAEMIDRRVAVIMATGGQAPAQVAKAATTAIPIVFTGPSDPVKAGLVGSLNRPGGNATGVLNISTELTAKRLALLRELAPKADRIVVLLNAANPDTAGQQIEIEEAARRLGQQILMVKVTNENEFQTAFTTMADQRAGALFVFSDALFTSHRARLVALAAQYGIPASYSFRDFPLDGGLMSYGASLLDVHRKAGVYVGRILKGEKPADLPVQRPTQFDLVINVKTAKALGLEISPTLLARADEVIE